LSTQKPWSRIDRAWAAASNRFSLMLPSITSHRGS
jgi:hypothetical protein